MYLILQMNSTRYDSEWGAAAYVEDYQAYLKGHQTGGHFGIIDLGKDPTITEYDVAPQVAEPQPSSVRKRRK